MSEYEVHAFQWQAISVEIDFPHTQIHAYHIYLYIVQYIIENVCVISNQIGTFVPLLAKLILN